MSYVQTGSPNATGAAMVGRNPNAMGAAMVGRNPMGDFSVATLGFGALALFAAWMYIIRPSRVRVVSTRRNPRKARSKRAWMTSGGILLPPRRRAARKRRDRLYK